MAEQKQGGDANAFIKEYGPIAERIGQQLDVDPKIILAQFGVETGWGKSVIPGTYNLGNIKSASGKGAKATDNVTKTTDAYLRFEDPEVFADYYVDYMKRQYPKVVGAKSNVGAFTTALRPGQRGGYAEDEEYGSKLDNAFSLVNARMGSQQGSQYESTFGVGTPTEAQRMREEGFGETTTTAGAPESETPDLDAALYGAGAGLIAGQVAKKTTLPTSAEFDRATKNLKSAERNLNEIKNQVAKHGNLPDLELEFKKAQGAYAAAEAELAQATDELKSARAARTAPVAAAPEPGLTPTPDQQARGIQGTTKDTGITGRASQTTYNERTAQIARNERAQRAALQGLQRQGIIDPSKAYALTEGISASTPSGVLVPPGEAAVSQAKLEAELAPYEQKAAQAKQARIQAGEEKRAASQAVKKAEKGAERVERAQGKVNIRAQELADAPPGIKGPLEKTGAATAKIAPRALGVVSGAATGMAAMEAIDRFKKGDYTGAVIPTLEATFGVMSMLPPAHPVLAALRGLGTIGGAALLGYEGYKYATKEPPPSADVAAP